MYFIAVTRQDDPLVKDSKFTFQPIDVPIGLYFEKIAPIRIFNSEWHIIYHMNLSSIQEEFTNIEATVDKLSTICKQLDDNYNMDYFNETTLLKSHQYTRECGSTFDQIQQMLINTREFNTEWFYSSKQPRNKRAPLNIVGSTMKSIFGTLAQEDAEDCLQRFKSMEKDGIERQVTIEQQTTLLKSTTQIISEMNEENIALQMKTQKQFSIVEKTIANLHYDYENLWLNMELQSQLGNLLMFISLAMTSFHSRQKQFLEAITFGSKASSATPIIIPPATFTVELAFIRQQIAGAELDLPLSIDKENMAYFYQIASTRSRIVNDQLLVSMSIPLLGLKQYDLIKLTSVPHLLPNGLYNFIISKHEYVAMDAFRETYVSLSNKELENCHDLREISVRDELICMQTSPVFDVSSSRDDCGITLLTKDYKPTNCDVRISNISQELWIKMRQPNTFFTVFPQKKVLYVKCSNTHTMEEQVEGTGIITMKQDCQIKTNEILLQAHNVYQSKLYKEIKPSIVYKWDFNETLKQIACLSNESINKIDSPNVISYGETAKLRHLSSSISDIQKKFNESLFTKYDLRQNTVQETNYWAFIFFILVLITSYTIILMGYEHYMQLKNSRNISPRVNSGENVNEPTYCDMKESVV